MKRITILLLKFAFALIIPFMLVSSFDTFKSVRVPILMYHHFDENVSNDMMVSPDTFDMHMKTLKDAGYTAVTFYDLVNYVENGTPLPPKPICITMDDGYLSNYTYAYPILEKYGMCATVFAVGVFSGWTNYRNTDYKIIPYFGFKEAKEMVDSGVMDIQCHSYDMHQWSLYESGDRPVRENILPLANESAEEYKTALTSDANAYIKLSREHLGYTPIAFAYPGGKYTKESESILRSLGFKVTLTTGSYKNILTQNYKSTLFRLGRFTVTNDVTSEELLDIIK